jgi:hypothetical protein
MILPHDANPGRMEFSERTVWQLNWKRNAGYDRVGAVVAKKNRAPVWGAVLLLDQMMQLCQSHLAAFAWASALPKGRW